MNTKSFIQEHITIPITDTRFREFYNIGKVSYKDEVYYLNLYTYNEYDIAICLGTKHGGSFFHLWIVGQSSNTTGDRGDFLKDITNYMLDNNILTKPKE